MKKYGVSRAEVAAWPSSPAARAALEEYFCEIEKVGPGGVFEGLAAPQCDFAGADLSGLYLGEAYLFGALLTGVSMADSDLTRANLSGAELERVDLSGAELSKAEIVESIANEAVLSRVDGFAADLSRSELRYVDARGAQLNSARLSGADLSYANLRGTVLSTVRFGNDRHPTRLCNAQLAGVTLTGAVGVVIGPVDVGDKGEPALLDGLTLAQWFADRGATEVSVLERG